MRPLSEMIHTDQDPRINAITGEIVNAAFEVHTRLGPGLLEKAYALCLERELRLRGLDVVREVVAPLVYRGEFVHEAAYRIDLLVNREVVVEVKAAETLLPLHKAQVLTYLKLTGSPVGILINFNSRSLRNGIHRIVRDVEPSESSGNPVYPGTPGTP